MKRLLHIAGSMTAYKDINGKLYFNGNYTPVVWQRFFDIADEVVVLCKIDNKVYTAEEAEKKFKKIPDTNFNVVFIHDLYSGVHNFFNMKIRKENERILEKEIAKCDGIDIKNLGFVTVDFFLRTVKKYNKRFLYECIGDAWDAMWNHGIKGKILAPKTFYDQKKIANNADMVLYVTDKFLQKRYPTNSPQIGISDVDIPTDYNDIIKARINRIKNNNGKKIILGTTAGIDVPYKGQKYVIKAISILKKQGYNDFEYQMVGKGNPQILQQLAKQEHVENSVKFLGPKSHDGVLDWLSSIDIYIQPSLQEGLPRALVEAMSMGLPAIGARTGGIPELLKEDCIFEKRKYKQLANILKRYNNKDRMIFEAKRNIKFSNTKFCKDESDARRTNFYKQFNHICESK